MSVSDRSIFAAAGLGPTLPETEVQAHGRAAVDRTVADLVRRSAEAHGALMRGDTSRYRETISYTDDFTLMSPFGGKPTLGSDLTGERVEAMSRFFRNGTFEQELVQAYGSTDMVVLAIIER